MAFLHLADIIEFCQVEAVANRIDPTAVARWRRFCRDYSQTFHTSYHLVLEMDPEFVILAVLEQQLDEVDPVEKIHDLMDRIYSIEDPNYEASKERELQDFIKDAEEEEEERIKDNKPIYVPKKKAAKPAEPAKPKKELPKSGFVDLSYLAKEEEDQ